MIRRANEHDIEAINRLLCQVLSVHADIRPDIFIPGTKKYRDEELLSIIKDDTRPVFVFVDDESAKVVAHAFCVFEETKGSNNLSDCRTLYIDDICVDEAYRGRHIAKALYEHVRGFAKANGCRRITLNVWEGNDAAKAFYCAMGMEIMKTTMEDKL